MYVLDSYNSAQTSQRSTSPITAKSMLDDLCEHWDHVYIGIITSERYYGKIPLIGQSECGSPPSSVKYVVHANNRTLWSAAVTFPPVLFHGSVCLRWGGW